MIAAGHDVRQGPAMAVPQPDGKGRLLRVVALPVAAAGYAALAVDRLPPSEPLVTTYGAASSTAHVVGLLAGVSLLLAGAATATQRPARLPGVLLTLAGVLWFAPDWVGWEGGPPLLRALATAVSPFLPVVLLHLVSVLLDSTSLRRATGFAYAVVAALSGSAILLVDPFLDPHCWRNCSDNPLLAWSLPEARPGLAVGLAMAWTVTGAAAAGAAAWWLARSTRTARRWHGLALSAVAVTGVVEAAYGAARVGLAETPRSDVFATAHLARAAAWLLLALAVAALGVRQQRRRTALARLARDLERAPRVQGLERALRVATGDGDLEVHYPLGSSGRSVTATGRSVPLSTSGPGRSTTELRRGSTAVAVLRHDPHLLPVDALQDVLGPAAQLALENERLTAEQLARLHDVQASRSRIVETGDAARRRLEHDLHDGAQQRLLALSYLVRLARAAAAPDVAELLDAAVTESQRALDDLRELAHGIHPAVLSEAGLAPALRSLADRAAVPVELCGMAELTDRRWPSSVELAAYALVKDAVRGAAGPLDVRAAQSADALVVEVQGCQGPVPEDVADRVGALGGRTGSSSSGWRAELPCG
jgi:signal transduction histidine kinase